MPKALKNYFLLAASLFFYAWGEPKHLLVMLFSILCNYLFGIWQSLSISVFYLFLNI